MSQTAEPLGPHRAAAGAFILLGSAAPTLRRQRTGTAPQFMPLRKRVFDVAFAVVLSAILAPVLLILMLVILLAEGRPIFYGGERMKAPGQSFRLWKLRTMTTDNRDTGVLGGDMASRITKTGIWLRETRLDELPQLWNIIKGDMSFVGPRPPLRRYVERFPSIYGKVLQSRPGVTGLATLRYHAAEGQMLAQCRTAEETDALYSRVSVPRKARLDLMYQKHQSLRLDLKLIGATVRVLVKKTLAQAG